MKIYIVVVIVCNDLNFIKDKPGCSDRTEGTSEDYFSCKQSSGFLMSPGYFDSYPPNLDLSWDLATKPWTQISLHFVELDVKSLEEGCDEDYVIIMDMSSQSSLGRFCDQKKPSGLVVSSLNRMEIRFHSDSIGSGYGFLAEYSSYLLIPDVINSKNSKFFGRSRYWPAIDLKTNSLFDKFSVRSTTKRKGDSYINIYIYIIPRSLTKTVRMVLVT